MPATLAGIFRYILSTLVMSFTTALLKDNLTQYLDAKVFWVAYSGGCDSHVLLHALTSLRAENLSNFKAEIKAIHINHGLSPLANEWEEHCRRTCEKLVVPYLAISVNAKKRKRVRKKLLDTRVMQNGRNYLRKTKFFYWLITRTIRLKQY